MKKPNITAKQLIAGDILEIETLDKSDLRIAEIGYHTRKGLGRFTLWFNGQCLYVGRTFGPLINRLIKLDISFPLDIK